MKSTTGTNLALGVAVLFSAACESPPKTTPEPTAKAARAPAKDVKTAEAPSAKGAAGNTAQGESPKAKEQTVHCLGIHECKGKSACHITGGHACAGQNACKGKGWIVVPATECEAKGGKVQES